MVDFYVNATTGDDGNSGVAPDRAFRSITRATEVAAGLPADTTGVIHVAEGIYGALLERFTLIIPQGFDLEGAGRDLTVIRFTGQIRTITGTSLAAWDGAALMAGNGVRNLTIEAEVVPDGYTCIGIDAILMSGADLDLENVMIRARNPDPRNRFRSSTFGSFNMRASRVTCQNTGHLGGGRRCVIRDCTFEDSSTSPGDVGEVVDCILRGWSVIGVRASSDASVLNNSLHGPATYIQISSDPDALGPPGPGPGPRVEGNRINVELLYGILCSGFGTALIRSNRILVIRHGCKGVLCENAAAPVFQNNHLESDHTWGRTLLSVESGAQPSFEGNTFVCPRPAGYHGESAIYLHSAADLGGGARGSRGNNDFSDFWHKIYAELDGGGTIFAQNNLWLSPGILTRQIETALATDINTDHARYLRS